MSEKALRNKVIRLAHTKPELRKHLLPLVKEAIGAWYDGLNRKQRNILDQHLKRGGDWADFDDLPRKLQDIMYKTDDLAKEFTMGNTGHHQLEESVEKYLYENDPKANRMAKKKASRELARFFEKGDYLYNFFSEKEIREQMYEKEDQNGVVHIISTEVVIEFISKTSGSERKKIEQTLRTIDFKNGRVEHFIEYLAGAIAKLYSSAW